MLKAVRFDPEEHANLLEYIENYRDKKNKPNHSEAIRNLMIKGLENSNKYPEPVQQTIDVEAIKADLFNQLMAQFNTMNMQPKMEPKPEPVQQKLHEVIEPQPQPSVPKPTPKPQNKPANTNPLLANILGNSNR